MRATGHNDLDLDSDVDIRAGSTLTSDAVFIEAESPRTEDTYDHDADADAATVVQTVVETLRVVQKKVSKIPIIGWFVKWITKLVTVVSQVILHSNESALLTGDFTSDNAINLAGDIFQGASSSPRLLINADGSLDSQFDQIPGASWFVYSLVVQSDGRILAGVEFTTLRGQTWNRIGRLNSDGPDPRTIVMTIVEGDGAGSFVETHATPIVKGRSAVLIEMTLATSDRPQFRVVLQAARFIRPLIERAAARLWVEDIAYAERRRALLIGQA